MHTAAVAVFGLLCAATVIYAVVGAGFARLLRRARPPQRTDEPLPRVIVFVPLRGEDPHLGDALARLLNQDYPDYTVSIVVDSESDSCWSSVRAAVAGADISRVHVETLRTRLDTCGRKCSALLQMLAHAPPERQVIVFMDGDVQLHPTSLRELVEPFRDEKVGATFGNRWFLPRARWGSVVRCLWNASSIAMMHVFRTPWAGCSAMRRSTLEKIRAAERWSRAIVDDACLRTAILREGFDIRFVPSLMIVNREECTLAFAFRFMMRQMAWTRLYVPTVWVQVVAITLVIAGLLLGGLGLATASVLQGRWDSALWSGGGVLLFVGCLYGLLGLMDHAVRVQARARGERLPAYGIGALIKIALGMPAALLFHLAATPVAWFKKFFTWRGVDYQVHGPWKVRVLRDQPIWNDVKAHQELSV